MDIFKEEPSERKIYWYWSLGGETGKTTFARYLHRKFGFIVLSGKAADMKNLIVDYDEKNGHTPDGIVMNIPKSFNEDFISYGGIEEIKDMFFCSGKYKGGMIDGNPPHVIVFANCEPDCEKMNQRFIIKNIGDSKGEYEFLDEIMD